MFFGVEAVGLTCGKSRLTVFSAFVAVSARVVSFSFHWV